MQKTALALASLLILTPVAEAQGLYPAGGYYGIPYTGGYLATPYPMYGASTGAVAGVAIGSGLLGAVIGAAISQPRPVQQVVQPGYVVAQPVVVVPVMNYKPVGYVRPRCPTGTAPTPRPMYDAYGNYLGQELVCY